MKNQKNIVASVNNSLNNINNNVKKVVRNDLVVNTIRVLLIVYTSFVIPQLTQNQLSGVNNNVVRLIVVSLIVYLAFLDMVTAMLLLIAFVVTIHHAGKSSSVGNNLASILGPKEENFINKIKNLNKEEINNVNESLNNKFNENSNITGNVLNENVALVNKGIEPTLNDSREILGNQINTEPTGINSTINTNAVVTQNNNESNNNLVNNVANNNVSNNNVSNNNVVNNNTEAVNEEINRNNKNQPSSETMTENILRAKGFNDDPNSPQGMITSQNLYDASENAVPGADINEQLMTFNNQMGVQGMDDISGPNARRYDGYHYNNEKERPNLTSEMILDRKQN